MSIKNIKYAVMKAKAAEKDARWAMEGSQDYSITDALSAAERARNWESVAFIHVIELINEAECTREDNDYKKAYKAIKEHSKAEQAATAAVSHLLEAVHTQTPIDQ